MANYWVFPITEDNLQICLEHGVVGAKGRNKKRLEKFQPGDFIVFYVSKKYFHRQMPYVREFQAVVECTGYAFESDEDIWSASGGEIFPHRVRIKVVDRKKCKIKPLIEDLSFIKNKKIWGSAFIGGVRTISRKDFDIIVQAMK